jgi:hypothetical protein
MAWGTVVPGREKENIANNDALWFDNMDVISGSGIVSKFTPQHNMHVRNLAAGPALADGAATAVVPCGALVARAINTFSIASPMCFHPSIITRAEALSEDPYQATRLCAVKDGLNVGVFAGRPELSFAPGKAIDYKKLLSPGHQINGTKIAERCVFRETDYK